MAKKKSAAQDTDREHVTFPKFTLHQLSKMVGAYEPSRPEVIRWIVQTWLHENRDKVAQQVQEYREYKADVASDARKTT